MKEITKLFCVTCDEEVVSYFQERGSAESTESFRPDIVEINFCSKCQRDVDTTEKIFLEKIENTDNLINRRNSMFIKASKKQSKLRLLLEGPSGSGKTCSALILATGIVQELYPNQSINYESKIALLDTEKGSASLYSGEEVSIKDNKFVFSTSNLLPPYEPEKYIEAIKFAGENDFDVLIIDSLTHEWNGEGGCLDIQSKLGGRYQDWAKITPRHNRFIEAILQSPIHIIATARTKSDYAMSQSGGKMKIEKLGLKTEQRDGLEFEFTTVLRLNQQHIYECSKDRTGLFIDKQGTLGKEQATQLMRWLDDGIDPLKESKSRLKECQTIQELQHAWGDIPAQIKSSLEKFKNEMKDKLEKQK